ncbi:ceramidase, partial [Entophlyctis helioformis]
FNLQRTLSSPNHSHFWGPPSSSVNWCETDYNVTSYVAEYFNTVSSLAMAAVGLLGVLLHPWAERRFHVAFLTIVVVGLGSVAFHGTLHKFAQALDEVPMLYSSLTFVYIGVCQRYRLLPSRRRLFATVLCLHAIVTTLLVTLSHGPLQFVLFHTSFGTAHVYALYHAVQVYRSRRARLMAAQHSLTSTQSSNGHIQQQQQQAPRDAILWTFERGAALYGSAMVCWIVDMTLCEYVNPGYESTAVLPINPQLHAWWHVLASLGLYNMTLLTLAARVETR